MKSTVLRVQGAGRVLGQSVKVTGGQSTVTAFPVRPAFMGTRTGQAAGTTSGSRPKALSVKAKGGRSGGGSKGGASSKGASGGKDYTPMTREAAARIQSAEARSGGGRVEKGSWAARAQSAADKNANAGLGGNGWGGQADQWADYDGSDDYDDDD